MTYLKVAQQTYSLECLFTTGMYNEKVINFEAPAAVKKAFSQEDLLKNA